MSNSLSTFGVYRAGKIYRNDLVKCSFPEFFNNFWEEVIIENSDSVEGSKDLKYVGDSTEDKLIIEETRNYWNNYLLDC